MIHEFFPSLRYIEICIVSFLLYKYWRPSWICAIFRLLRKNSAWHYIYFFLVCHKVLDWLFWIIIFCYIIIVNFVVFHRFQFSNDLLFNKSISSIESSVQKKTAQEMTKDSNTYNSFKLENCQPSTVSGHHFLDLHLF